MKRFARLFAELDATTATGAKVDALKRYFAAAAPRDAAWAVYFLAGGKPRQVVPITVLGELACRVAGIDGTHVRLRANGGQSPGEVLQRAAAASGKP